MSANDTPRIVRNGRFLSIAFGPPEAKVGHANSHWYWLVGIGGLSLVPALLDRKNAPAYLACAALLTLFVWTLIRAAVRATTIEVDPDARRLTIIREMSQGNRVKRLVYDLDAIASVGVRSQTDPEGPTYHVGVLRRVGKSAETMTPVMSSLEACRKVVQTIREAAQVARKDETW